MANIDVKSVLVLWGGYVRFTDCKGYPRMQAFMRESLQERKRRQYLVSLDDETLEKVDRQMRKLEANNQLQFDILFNKYVRQKENKKNWQELGIRKSTFENELRLAERFIEGALLSAEIKIFL